MYYVDEPTPHKEHIIMYCKHVNNNNVKIENVYKIRIKMKTVLDGNVGIFLLFIFKIIAFIL